MMSPSEMSSDKNSQLKNRNQTYNQINENSETIVYYQKKLLWKRLIGVLFLNFLTIFAFILLFEEPEYALWIISLLFILLGNIGITAGTHRFWAHGSYNAGLLMRITLMFWQTFANQKSIHKWVLEHRLHHKYMNTDADPYDSREGFFFSHIGWLIYKQHPEVKEKEKTIDMKDINADRIVQFQKNYFEMLAFILNFLLPTIVPSYIFGCSIQNSFLICCIARYTISLHLTWIINSGPILLNLLNRNNSNFHYHHIFPWDYKTYEYSKYCINSTKYFIEIMKAIGLGSELRIASDEMIQQRIKSMETDENSINLDPRDQLDLNNETTLIWGWNDTDMSTFDRQFTCIENNTLNLFNIDFNAFVNMCSPQFAEL